MSMISYETYKNLEAIAIKYYNQYNKASQQKRDIIEAINGLISENNKGTNGNIGEAIDRLRKAAVRSFDTTIEKLEPLPDYQEPKTENAVAINQQALRYSMQLEIYDRTLEVLIGLSQTALEEMEYEPGKCIIGPEISDDTLNKIAEAIKIIQAMKAPDGRPWSRNNDINHLVGCRLTTQPERHPSFNYCSLDRYPVHHYAELPTSTQLDQLQEYETLKASAVKPGWIKAFRLDLATLRHLAIDKAYMTDPEGFVISFQKGTDAFIPELSYAYMELYRIAREAYLGWCRGNDVVGPLNKLAWYMDKQKETLLAQEKAYAAYDAVVGMAVKVARSKTGAEISANLEGLRLLLEVLEPEQEATSTNDEAGKP